MDYSEKINGNTLKLSFSGRFTFHDLILEKFLRKISDQKISNMIINMTNLKYIDSAALGMLLILDDAIKNNNGTITVSGLHGQVDRVFLAAQMAKRINVI